MLLHAYYLRPFGLHGVEDGPMLPRLAQESLRHSQKALKTAQEGTKTAQGLPKTVQARPRTVPKKAQ
eukprot:706132-Pyramimonas_sp.AAC.1